MRSLIPVVLLLASSTTVAAQTDPARWRVSVSGGAQSESRAVTDRFEFQENIETASNSVRYRGNPDVLVDLGAGFRFWRNIGAGVAVSRFTHDGSATIDATRPHPFFFGRPRTFSADIRGVTRTETAAHVQVFFDAFTSEHLRLVLSAGPSSFHVEQDLVDQVEYDEVYPYDTATFRNATTKTSKATAAGFNAGADLAWMFTHRVGAGLLLRWSRGRVELDTPDDRTIKVNVGGAQGGIGLRLLF